jgi:hypothetical protein
MNTRFLHSTAALAAILVATSAHAELSATESAKIAHRYVVANWMALPMKYSASDSIQTIIQNDIRAAEELGLDGFALNAFYGKQARDLFTAFIDAADSIGASNFKFFLSADMSLGFSAKDIVDTIKIFGNNPHYMKINQKPLLSTFGGGELGDKWWKDGVLTPLKDFGVPVTFIPNFDRTHQNWDPPDYDVWLKVIQEFPSIDGLFNFGLPGSTPFYSNDSNIGNHLWSILEGEENLAHALNVSGKFYIAPFGPYYWAVCHPVRQYMEHQGARGMDNWWRSLITKQKPDVVEIVTWNDYSESTFVQPTRIPNTKTPGIESMPHLGYYEILKYYISWFHYNNAPSLIGDALFFFYRIHSNAAVAVNDASACPLGSISPAKKFGKIEDVIYVTTALTAPATLKVEFANSKREYDLPAGLHTTDVPFGTGKPNLELWRNSKKLTGIVGHEIEETPTVYNFNVYSGYAIVNGETSETWMPSDKWTNGLGADWFRNSNLPVRPRPPLLRVRRSR